MAGAGVCFVCLCLYIDRRLLALSNPLIIGIRPSCL